MRDKIKTLFVDFDGTICTDRFWRSLDSEKQGEVQSLLFSDDTATVDDWMRGKFSSEEIVKYVSEKIGFDYQTLWEVFVDDCSNMKVSEEILNLIQHAREKFHTVLITGNMDCFERFTAPALQLDRYFAEIVNSANEGILKTENNGESFKKYLRGDIVDAVLIEDSEKSCRAFQNLGGTAYRVTGMDDTVRYLERLVGD